MTFLNVIYVSMLLTVLVENSPNYLQLYKIKLQLVLTKEINHIDVQKRDDGNRKNHVANVPPMEETIRPRLRDTKIQLPLIPVA